MHEPIDLILEGGPPDLPEELRKRRAGTVEEKIKIPHRGGYEHFERAETTPGSHVVYRWTMRTKIAE